MLSGHHQSHKDQEQEKTVQKSVSGQQTNLGIRKDEWDHQSQTSNANCCCQDSYLIAQGKTMDRQATGKNNALSLKFYTVQSNILTFWLQFNT